MMEKISNTYVYYCDGCPEDLEIEESEFHVADQSRKDQGWICFKDSDGDWVHYCTVCQKEKMGS